MFIRDEKAYMDIVEEIGEWETFPETFMFNPEKVEQLRRTRERLYEFFGEDQIDGDIRFYPSSMEFGNVMITFYLKRFIIWDPEIFSYVTEFLSDYGVSGTSRKNFIFSGTIEDVAVDLST